MGSAQVKRCVELIRESCTIGALTGAGISTRAGIPDFRGPQGLYVTRRYDADKIFDIEYFCRDPKPFYAFARDFIALEKDIQPTFTHRFLRRMEEAGRLAGVVTQNIDSLHQRAGARNVIEVHGSFWQSHCRDCGRAFSYERMKDKVAREEVPSCDCGGVIKPDVVFFGERVRNIEAATALAGQCDLFFVIGTSCVVYPAAALPAVVPGEIVVVNQGPVIVPGREAALAVEEDIDGFFEKVAQGLDVI